MAQEPVALEGAIAQRDDEFVKTALAALDLRQFDAALDAYAVYGGTGRARVAKLLVSGI